MTRIATLATGLDFPEGPSVAADGAIWLSELRGGTLVHIAPDGATTRHAVGGAPNGTAIAPDGGIWFCDAANNQVRRLDPSTGETRTVADNIDGDPLFAPNDLAFDPDGGLVFTCPGDSRREPTGYVCRRTTDGAVTRIARGLLFPNGICFSADGSRMFVGETYAQRVVAGDWADPLLLEPAIGTPGPIGADGVAADARGGVFTCVYGAGVVRHMTPAGAVRDIAVDDAHPAGCAVDPLGRWDLLVTGTERGTLLGIVL